MIFLDVEEILHIATRVLDGDVAVRDGGLLASAAARPEASVFGQDAYATVHTKAAALLHSIVNNHALVDGNKRLGLACTIAFLGMNGWRLTLSNDEAYDLVIAVASSQLTEVDDIADVLAAGSEPSSAG